jgi:carbonic anhydrase
MRFGKSVLTAAFAIGLSLAAFNASAGSGAHWAYEGEHGPDHWGHMSGEYKACSEGKTQSPIDLTGAASEELAEIKFDYKASKLNAVNNGHTVQVNYDNGSSISVNGEQYNLVQFHFHTPSEHTVAGKSFGNEMHLVHKNDKGELAVVGVLIENGQENAAYKAIWSNLPKKANEKKSVAVDINASELLPKDRKYFTYSGSLTTPPCSENVRWIVLQTPIQMSEGQIKEIQKIMHNNNRPVQKMHDRVLKISK